MSYIELMLIFMHANPLSILMLKRRFQYHNIMGYNGTVVTSTPEGRSHNGAIIARMARENLVSRAIRNFPYAQFRARTKGRRGRKNTYGVTRHILVGTKGMSALAIQSGLKSLQSRPHYARGSGSKWIVSGLTRSTYGR